MIRNKKMKKNEKTKDTKTLTITPSSTIGLDKLVFSCISTVDDNFNYIVAHAPEYCYHDFKFDKTKLIRTQDLTNRFRHSFKVYYDTSLMGVIDFSMYGKGIYDGIVRFSLDNESLYNGTLKYIPTILNCLNLKINNFTKIDIALDSYVINIEQVLRRALKDKGNNIKLFNHIVKDRNKVLKEITYFNSGSLNNTYKLRTILIRDKKKRKELICYDKKEEINEVSKKDYILKYHQKQNPQYKKIYRAEIRFSYEEIRRYSKKIKRTITFDDLLDPQFLTDMFFEYFNRIITIYKGQGRKKTKIQLIDKPDILLHPQGILQPTPTVSNSTSSISKNGYFDLDKFMNEYFNNLHKNQTLRNNIKNKVNIYLILLQKPNLTKNKTKSTYFVNINKVTN